MKIRRRLGRRRDFPTLIDYLLRGEYIEYAIATENYEVVFAMIDTHDFDLGFGDDDIPESTQVGVFGLDVSKGTGYTQPARKDSGRSLLAIKHRMVDLSPTGVNPFPLLWLVWLVVLTEVVDGLSVVPTQHCPAVSHIYHVDQVIHHHGCYATGPRLVNRSTVLSLGQKSLLAHRTPFLDGLSHILGETLSPDDEGVQMVPEEVSTLASAMAVEYAEVATAGPLLFLHGVS